MHARFPGFKLKAGKGLCSKIFQIFKFSTPVAFSFSSTWSRKGGLMRIQQLAT